MIKIGRLFGTDDHIFKYSISYMIFVIKDEIIYIWMDTSCLR